MDALEKLSKAMELMKEAQELVEAAQAESESLSDYYGYSLTTTAQQLDIFGANDRCYMTCNTSLEEIIEEEGNHWNN